MDLLWKAVKPMRHFARDKNNGEEKRFLCGAMPLFLALVILSAIPIFLLHKKGVSYASEDISRLYMIGEIVSIDGNDRTIELPLDGGNDSVTLNDHFAIYDAAQEDIETIPLSDLKIGQEI